MRRDWLVIAILSSICACTEERVTARPPPSPPPSPAPINVPPTKPDPAKLVARLVDAKGTFHSLEKDPAIAAVLALGGAAVPALIDAVERDDRPTGITYDREKEWEKTSYAPVWRVAYVLLEQLMASSYFADQRPLYALIRGERPRIAGELRAEWTKVGGVSREERWYGALADDAADSTTWMDAAKKILEWADDPHVYDPSDVTRNVPLAGEPLRRHAPPSVTDLVLRRAGGVDIRDACELVRLLARWDRAAASPAVADRMRKAIAASGRTHEYGHCIHALATVRSLLGDTAALDEFAAWIGTTTPPTDDWDANVFSMLGAHPTRPSLVAAGDRLFAPASPWLPLVATRQRAQLLDIQWLYRAPAFQRHVRTALADARVIGSVYANADGGWGIESPQALSFSTSVDRTTKDFPAAATKIPLRVRDYYAYSISRHTNAPPFALYWPLARRDAAIAAAITWVDAQ